MIIFGHRGITSSQGGGTFHCPQCRGPRQYTQKRVRRFFTLYFIPVIPLDVLSEYVECNYCHGAYNPEVLTYDPGAEQRRVRIRGNAAIRRALTAVLVADGDPSEEESEVALDVIRKITGDSQISRGDLDEGVVAAKRSAGSMVAQISEFADVLSYEAKESLIKGAIHIASVDGATTPEEKQRISELATAIGITQAHLGGLMASLPPPSPQLAQ